jgi:hypothetical protein
MTFGLRVRRRRHVATWNTRALQSHEAPAAKQEASVMTDAQIKHMVDRFLMWRLPKPWNPDNGVSYERPNYAHPPADHDWPVGTNLFDADQTTAMVRYMIDGLPAAPAATQSAGIDWTPELEAARLALCEFWIAIADDPHEGGIRYPELGRKAIETEQALTILGEIARHSAGADWLTIDSAPKDGTRILIRFEHDNYKYASPEDRDRWEEVCIAHWVDHSGGGWTWHGICGIPTHWMPLPLPAPPAQKQEGE